ncbi:MAG TPA: hypothetical protein VI757_10515 [Bacteroidia bacterium]|nr:hypothetical protein [Bacteroidia bacterium]
MTIEKPFSTIRKAIEGSAEKQAENEFLEKPEHRHYKAAFDFYKTVRALAPEKVELLIKAAAKAKVLKDGMGGELYKTSNQVLDDLMEGSEKQFNDAVDQIKESGKLSEKELHDEILKLNTRFIKIKMDEFKKDPRIVTTYAGKEELMNKFIDMVTSSTLNILNAYEKNPAQLREISLKEFFEILARRQRGKPTATELKEKIMQEKLSKGLFSKIIKFFRSID